MTNRKSFIDLLARDSANRCSMKFLTTPAFSRFAGTQLAQQSRQSAENQKEIDKIIRRLFK